MRARTARGGPVLVALLVVAALSPPPVARAQPPPAYSSEPFLQSLVPAWRGRITKALQVSSLAELPLYQLEIDFHPLAGRLVQRLGINYTNRESVPLEQLVLRLYANLWADPQQPALTVSELRRDGRPVSHRQPHPTVLEIELEPPLPPGGRLLLELEATARIPRLRAAAGGLDQLLGGAASDYGLFGQRQGIFNLAFFYPVLAPRRGGNWDRSVPAPLGDPAGLEPANYLVRLRLPRAVQVASGARLAGSQSLTPGPGGERVLFLVGCALRHLALQASSRYLVVTRRAGPVQLRALVLDGNAELGERLIDEAQAALTYYQSHLGAYPYTHLDVAVAALQGGAGGMEFPALVTVADGVAQPRAASALGGMLARLLGQTQTTEFVLAHELAHQWFNVLVGTDPQRHPFLDEALANYLAVMFFESHHGAKAAELQLSLQLLAPYRLWRALGRPDGAVLRPTRDFSGPLEYAALVYGKGAVFYHFLRRRWGRQKLLGCLRGLVARRAFAVLEPQQLRRQLGTCAAQARRFESWWQRWLHEAHGDADLERLGLGDYLQQLMQRVQSLGGLHNMKLDGAIDPATLRLWQQAVRQLTGQ